MNTHYAIATLPNGKELLVYATEGSFASDAWIRNDNSFNDIAARSFIAITADDGQEYNVGRNVRRPTEDEVKNMFETACSLFKLQVELREKPIKKSPKAYSDSVIFFEVLPRLVEEWSIEEIKDYFDNNLLAK